MAAGIVPSGVVAERRTSSFGSGSMYSCRITSSAPAAGASETSRAQRAKRLTLRVTRTRSVAGFLASAIPVRAGFQTAYTAAHADVLSPEPAHFGTDAQRLREQP